MADYPRHKDFDSAMVGVRTLIADHRISQIQPNSFVVLIAQLALGRFLLGSCSAPTAQTSPSCAVTPLLSCSWRIRAYTAIGV
jgi:hypothetical protein